MPPLLTTQNLAKAFGTRPLFESLNLGLNDGEKTGLIGPNGAGKSTLLKILAQCEEPDAGDVARRKGLTVHYLEQTTDLDAAAEQTAREFLHAAGVTEKDADAGLAKAAFPDKDQKLGTLSGGWRKRLAILAALLQKPDLLLLDEPTNHLDLEGVLWLERTLQEARQDFVVVTHDRRFLERVANRVIELNPIYKEGCFSAPGNYSKFLERREQFLEAEHQQKASLANQVRREIEWLRRGPKARTTKQNARIDRAHEMMGDLAEMKRRHGQDRKTAIDFQDTGRKSTRLVRVSEASLERGGRTLFSELDLILSPGSKLGLVGANGAGKSSFLKMLSGALKPSAGFVKHAQDLRVVHFDQHREQLDLSLSLRQALSPTGDHVLFNGKKIHVNGWAERFLFRREQMAFPLSRLSGGEQSRVLIARLMLQPADLLLLDEPTNDLDIGSLEVLEQSLTDFAGALVLVTHDRYLLDRVCDVVLGLDGQGGAAFYGDVEQWEARLNENEGSVPSFSTGSGAQKAPLPEAPKNTPSRLSHAEFKELTKLEKKIEKAEADVAAAQERVHDPAIASDAPALTAAAADLKAAEGALEELLERWAELEEKR